MTITAKRFMSGRSRAIRLKAKPGLQAQVVRIEQIGGALWMQLQIEPWADMGQWLQTFYASTEPPPP